MELRSIALDGPSGAGKSTLAKMAAEHFGIIYVDTGALYRCIGLHVLRNGISSKDLSGVTKLLPEIILEMKYDSDGSQRTLLCGEDVTGYIRMPEVSKYASDVSAMPPVRDSLLSMQREMALKYDVVMDGRDIGTVVLPQAGLKVFLTAEPEVRARRRFIELREKNVDTSYEEVMNDMVNRDKNDSERAAAPLIAAKDAVILDTTDINIEESAQILYNLIEGRFGK